MLIENNTKSRLVGKNLLGHTIVLDILIDPDYEQTLKNLYELHMSNVYDVLNGTPAFESLPLVKLGRTMTKEFDFSRVEDRAQLLAACLVMLPKANAAVERIYVDLCDLVSKDFYLAHGKNPDCFGKDKDQLMPYIRVLELRGEL